MSDRDDFYAALHDDLRVFIEWAFTVLNPGVEYKHNWHIDAIIYKLMKCYRGETKRLLITLPPRSLKSHCVSIAFVAWVLGRHPDRKFICASYGEAIGSELAQATRSLMQHPDYQKAFPGTRFADNAPLDMMRTKAHGYRMTTSVGAAATGFGADFIIADDLTKADASEGERAKACNFYQGTLMSRFNEKAAGVAIVVAQRTAVDDLPGVVLDRGGYTHLDLPAIAQADEKIDTGPRSCERRRKGVLLHETRENRETLERIRREIGDDNFAAQYLQRPSAHMGAILDPAWFRTYEEPRPKHRYAYRVLSIDTALSKAITADYSVCSVFGGSDSVHDLLHVWRDHVGYEDLSAKVDAMIKEWSPTHIIIEYSNAGISLHNRLRERFARGLIGFQSKMKKEERLAHFLNFFKKGSVRLPEAAPWKAEFANEIFSFPCSAHDDQLDTLVQFANYAEPGFHRQPAIELVRGPISHVDESSGRCQILGY